MPQTSTKRRLESKDELLEPAGAPANRVERARRRIRQGYYDRPEVRRTLATLILHRAAQKTLASR